MLLLGRRRDVRVEGWEARRRARWATARGSMVLGEGWVWKVVVLLFKACVQILVVLGGFEDGFIHMGESRSRKP